MFREFWLLAKLEGKRLRRNIRYWLNLIGFDTHQSQLYQLYLSGFWSFWLFAMWSFLIEQIYSLSSQISPQDTMRWLQLVPLGIFVLQVLFLIQVLRDGPLKLDAASLLYIATAPVSRGVITITYFFRNMLVPVIFISLIGTLAAMFFAWRLYPDTVGVIGLYAFTITACLVYLTGASCWIVGLLKQNRQTVYQKHIFWLIIPLMLFACAWFPQLGLWSGHVWISTITSGAISTQIILLLSCLMIALVLLYGVGQRVQMTFVIADSQIYARIQKIGVFGRIMSADTIARIRHQSRLSKKQVFQTGLSVNLTGNRVLIGQSYLMVKRHSPEELFYLLTSGVILVSIVVLTTRSFGESGIQTWVFLFILMLQIRPYNVTRTFREHLYQPYLRQFMPQNLLLLFVLCTVLPFTIMSLGMVAFLIVQPWIEVFVGSLLAISSLMTASLCLGLSMVRVTRYALPHLAYEYSVLFTGTLIVGSGYLSQSLWIVFGTTIVINIFLMFFLYHSKSG